MAPRSGSHTAVPRSQSLISFKIHGGVYSFCLVMSTLVVIFVHSDVLTVAAGTCLAFLFRTQLRFNKYLIWGCYTAFLVGRLALGMAPVEP